VKTLFAVLILLCGLAVGGAQAQPARPVPQADNAPHQVLVMLRLPPQHFRPDGAYAGGYLDDGGGAARRRVAGDLAVAYGLKVRENWPMPVIGVDCFLMEDSGGAPLARVLDALARDPRVAWVQPVEEYRGMDAGPDPLYPVQPAAKAWHLSDLHRMSTGRDVTVAVIDSGVDAAHPDLAGQVALRRNFVEDVPDAAEAHGTAVAGIIAARAGNGVGIAGIAPGARLLALRACWETGGQSARCSSLTLGKAINFALENGARVLNLSLAGPPDRLLQALVDGTARSLQRRFVTAHQLDDQKAAGNLDRLGILSRFQLGDGGFDIGRNIRIAHGKGAQVAAFGGRGLIVRFGVGKRCKIVPGLQFLFEIVDFLTGLRFGSTASGTGGRAGRTELHEDSA